jgi:hypothetical protein
VKPSSLFVVTGAAIALGAVVAGAPAGRVAVAATPPPTPPPIGTPALTPQPNASLLPTPAATLVPLTLGSAKPSPKPSPHTDARKGLDGVWEVQIQHPNSTEYTHFLLTQQGDALSGSYLDAKNKKYPLVGTVDGQDVRVIVSLPNGTTLLLEGKLDGTTDMIGLLTAAGGQVPFTASYRAKEKWIENVNASPGGISQPGGYTPP